METLPEVTVPLRLLEKLLAISQRVEALPISLGRVESASEQMFIYHHSHHMASSELDGHERNIKGMMLPPDQVSELQFIKNDLKEQIVNQSKWVFYNCETPDETHQKEEQKQLNMEVAQLLEETTQDIQNQSEIFDAIDLETHHKLNQVASEETKLGEFLYRRSSQPHLEKTTLNVSISPSEPLKPRLEKTTLSVFIPPSEPLKPHPTSPTTPITSTTLGSVTTPQLGPMCPFEEGVSATSTKSWSEIARSATKQEPVDPELESARSMMNA